MEKNYPYRFKTELEMETQYGKNWRKTQFIIVGWVSDMDYLFGMEYPYFITELTPNIKTHDIGGWSISWDMLIKNKPTEPSYKPKEKILRTL